MFDSLSMGRQAKLEADEAYIRDAVKAVVVELRTALKEKPTVTYLAMQLMTMLAEDPKVMSTLVFCYAETLRQLAWPEEELPEI